MDFNSKTNKLTIDEHINGVVADSPDILYKLSKLGVSQGSTVEIVTELPASADPDIVLGYVRRWVDIQKAFDCELRVYAWSYTTEVEKYVLACTQTMSHIHITALPMYLKENCYGK